MMNKLNDNYPLFSFDDNDKLNNKNVLRIKNKLFCFKEQIGAIF